MKCLLVYVRYHPTVGRSYTSKNTLALVSALRCALHVTFAYLVLH